MLAGASAQTVVNGLTAWRYQNLPQSGKENGFLVNILNYCRSLETAAAEAIHTGASVQSLLKLVSPRVRRLERFAARMDGLEKQFGFQGAIVLVLPWAVAAAQKSFTFNWFYVAALGFQIAGGLLFFLLLSRVQRSTSRENDFLLVFLTKTWMRVECGENLDLALNNALQSGADKRHRDFRLYWIKWRTGIRTGALVSSDFFSWPPWMSESADVGRILLSLLDSGAPAADTLANLVAELEDARHDDFEQRVQEIPTRLSLIFCVSFTPAVFLILIGSLWPNLNTLMM